MGEFVKGILTHRNRIIKSFRTRKKMEKREENVGKFIKERKHFILEGEGKNRSENRMIHFNLLFCYFVKRGKKALSLK